MAVGKGDGIANLDQDLDQPAQGPVLCNLGFALAQAEDFRLAPAPHKFHGEPRSAIRIQAGIGGALSVT